MARPQTVSPSNPCEVPAVSVDDFMKHSSEALGWNPVPLPDAWMEKPTPKVPTQFGFIHYGLPSVCCPRRSTSSPANPMRCKAEAEVNQLSNADEGAEDDGGAAVPAVTADSFMEHSPAPPRSNPLPLTDNGPPTAQLIPATSLMPSKFGMINYGPPSVGCPRRSSSSPANTMRSNSEVDKQQSADGEAGDEGGCAADEVCTYGTLKESRDDEDSMKNVGDGSTVDDGSMKASEGGDTDDGETIEDDSSFSFVQVPGRLVGSGSADPMPLLTRASHILKAMVHQSETCQPCASFYLEGRCNEGDSCKHCHFCSKQVANTTILSQLLEKTTHEVDRSNPKKWSCLACNVATLPGQSRNTAAFLTRQCIPGPPPWMHPSHQYGRNARKVFCLRCGGYSTRYRVSPKLRRECGVPQDGECAVRQQTLVR